MTIEEVKELNSKVGQHWFSPAAMRFFNSRVGGKVRVEDGKAYFISSERMDYNHPRLYSLRVCNLITGDIDTVGKFQSYPTRYLALQAMKIVKG